MKKYVVPYSFDVKGYITVEMDDDAKPIDAKILLSNHLEECQKSLCRDVLTGFKKGCVKIK